MVIIEQLTANAKYNNLWLNAAMSRISLLIHESEVEPRTNVNNKDILYMSMMGFN